MMYTSDKFVDPNKFSQDWRKLLRARYGKRDRSFGEPRIPNLRVGDIVVIAYDSSKPNDHFQFFMARHIGKEVEVTAIQGKDGYGYRIVKIKETKVKEVDGRGSFLYIPDWCWREYDFLYSNSNIYNEYIISNDDPLFRI